MIIYQIYPRSFLDTNGDGVGDLPGIIDKLDYVADLGADAIWVSPFFASPMQDFGYDIADHCRVDPVFGSMADLRRLVRRADELSLKVLIDLVASHTSDQHAWFRGSVARTDGKADWYVWAAPKPDGTPPNNWLSVFGGSAWQWHPVRRQYFYHSFLPSQPDLNLHNAGVQDEILGIMRFWLNEGIAGFRLDACNHYFHDPQLRDNPPRPDGRGGVNPYASQVHLYDQGRPEILPFLRRVRGVLDEFGAFSVGEVGGTDPIALMGDYTGVAGLHAAYSFALMRADHGVSYLRGVVEKTGAVVKPPAMPCYAFSNHDKPRVVTRWGDGRYGPPVAKLYLALLLSLPGHICLYQGEELGLSDADIPFERLQDPYGKMFWPAYKGRDGARTPMPWSGETRGGFTTGEAWLPIPAAHLEINADAQEADAASTLSFARRMIALRKEQPGLFTGGEIAFVDAPDHVLAFRRTHAGSAVACWFNLGSAECSVTAPSGGELVSQAARRSAGELRLGEAGFWIGRA